LSFFDCQTVDRQKNIIAQYELYNTESIFARFFLAVFKSLCIFANLSVCFGSNLQPDLKTVARFQRFNALIFCFGNIKQPPCKSTAADIQVYFIL
jgi:hypothetical protein